MLQDISRISKQELLLAIERMEKAETHEELEEAHTVAVDGLDALYNSMLNIIDTIREYDGNPTK